MDECIFNSNRNSCILREKGKSVRFENPSGINFDEARVDDCLIRDHRERCDYFVRNEKDIWLIELKGSDCGKAVSQIVSSIEHLKHEIGGRKCIPVIVIGKTPAIVNHHRHLKLFSSCKDNIGKNLILRTGVAKIKME